MRFYHAPFIWAQRLLERALSALDTRIDVQQHEQQRLLEQQQQGRGLSDMHPPLLPLVSAAAAAAAAGGVSGGGVGGPSSKGRLSSCQASSEGLGGGLNPLGRLSVVSATSQVEEQLTEHEAWLLESGQTDAYLAAATMRLQGTRAQVRQHSAAAAAERRSQP